MGGFSAHHKEVRPWNCSLLRGMRRMVIRWNGFWRMGSYGVGGRLTLRSAPVAYPRSRREGIAFHPHLMHGTWQMYFPRVLPLYGSLFPRDFGRKRPPTFCRA